jgi:hypothetical protein
MMVVLVVEGCWLQKNQSCPGKKEPKWKPNSLRTVLATTQRRGKKEPQTNALVSHETVTTKSGSWASRAGSGLAVVDQRVANPMTNQWEM